MRTEKHLVNDPDILGMGDRVAVKFAYDGTMFMGSQRQPRKRTAESELLGALIKIGAISSVQENHFRVASRTDRGVSALGNVFAVNTSFRRQELLGALNASCQDVYCYAWAEVSDTFSPRRAKGRWYRYNLPYKGQDLGMMAECATGFQGEHEFRLFCKPEGKVTVRTLDSVEVRLEGDTIIIDLKAREFLHNMVRRVVSALDQVGQGRASLDQVRSALQGKGRSLGVAEAEGLFLMDVDHGLDMCSGPLGPMAERVTKERDIAMVRWQFNQLLLEKSCLAPRTSKN
ncbi:MAG: tRNA pseudouridine(38-40) synthase TruA [Methanomassiliicoccales archaeon]|nr:tRNA pseudouridine(38-40) synthase TruA [Methanomassiliicoccales archaeon]